jgi:hypothetical protein
MVEARGGACAYFASTMPGLGGMAQRSLGDEHALMDSCRVGALSGTMAASMVRLVRGSTLIYHPGDGLAESGRT